ncbi:MAG TPA: MBL fold metallo-hydrolase [Moorella mulderi]|nr:MBL fold metallo-hydrolase [Moorella mulderi]
MRIIILGRYSPYPPPRGACPGYLIEGQSTRILLDCGSGVLSRLQEHIPFWQLDAIILSHLHGDHMSDLWVYRYALDQARAEGKIGGPLPVWAPPDPPEVFQSLTYREAMEARSLSPGEELRIGEFGLNFFPARHSLSGVSMRISDGSKTLFYTGDTEYFGEVAIFAKGSHLLLAEATYREEDIIQGATGHMSAGQAARLAQEAQCSRLILTHIRPWYDPGSLLSEAQKLFPQSQLAQEGMRIEI